MIHIIYIPGLGDGYDPIRRFGLFFWKRHDVNVTHVPMNWSHQSETFEDKLARIEHAIDTSHGSVVLVGESAGGAMAVVATHLFRAQVVHTITLCGMNRGAQNVNPRLYRHNPAFKTTMQHADRAGAELSDNNREAMTIVYSSNDLTVRPRNTLLPGVDAIDLKSPGHAFTILGVLYFRTSLMARIVKRKLGDTH